MRIINIKINKAMEVTYEDDEYEDACHSCGEFEEYENGDGIDIVTKDNHEITGDIVEIGDDYVTVEDCETGKNVTVNFNNIKAVDTY